MATKGKYRTPFKEHDKKKKKLFLQLVRLGEPCESRFQCCTGHLSNLASQPGCGAAAPLPFVTLTHWRPGPMTHLPARLARLPRGCLMAAARGYRALMMPAMFICTRQGTGAGRARALGGARRCARYGGRKRKRRSPLDNDRVAAPSARLISGAIDISRRRLRSASRCAASTPSVRPSAPASSLAGLRAGQSQAERSARQGAWQGEGCGLRPLEAAGRPGSRATGRSAPPCSALLCPALLAVAAGRSALRRLLAVSPPRLARPDWIMRRVRGHGL